MKKTAAIIFALIIFLAGLTIGFIIGSQRSYFSSVDLNTTKQSENTIESTVDYGTQDKPVALPGDALDKIKGGSIPENGSFV